LNEKLQINLPVNSQFGYAVDLLGETLIISAPVDNNQGAAYLMQTYKELNYIVVWTICGTIGGICVFSVIFFFYLSQTIEFALLQFYET